MRYFLHIGDAEEVIVDEEGLDFSDLEAARAEARASIQDLVADDIRRGRLAARRHIDITDEHGATLARVALAVTVI